MAETKQQLQAIQAKLNNVCVVAGAGSGKTYIISKRVEFLLSKGIKQDNIVVLAFTRKAAQEIGSRVKAKILCSTFHQFCLMVIRSMPSVFGEQFIVIDQDDQERLMNLSIGDPEFSISKKNMVSLFSYQRNTKLPFTKVVDNAKEDLSEDDAKVIFSSYQRKKKDFNLMDFDDILVVFDKQLRDEKFARYIATKFKYVFVDEFQDTNKLQFDILDKLVKHGSVLYCVGDPAQSIYGFRGSDYRRILKFSTYVPNATIYKLETNFRSYQPILDISDNLLSKSSIQYDKRMVAHRSGPLHIPELHTFATEDLEARFVASKITGRFDDYMIIVRTSFGGKRFEMELLARKIPYVFIGGQSLLNMAHIKDVLAILKLAYNNKDQLAAYRFFNMWPGIGDAKAKAFINELITGTLNDKMSNILNIRDMPIDSAIDHILGAMNNVFNAMYGKSWQSRKNDLLMLKTMASKFKDVPTFINTYMLNPVEGTKDANNQVLLITAHSSKGMERKTVFVSRVQPGNFPHFRSEVEEERRLLYVAMTRAKDKLIMTRSGDIQYGHDFLEELDEGLFTNGPNK
jgi:DNA helicase-2/ATP-dependent DNA helicase PcrA